MRCAVAAAALLAAICPIRAHAQPRLEPAQPIPWLELEAYVDGMVHHAMAAEHIAGVSVAVVQDGQLVLKKGYGFADVAAGRRVDPDRTLFRIGSITKTFTWIALMNAVAAGHIGLDDPINTHLPEALRIPDDGFAEPIRVRHLLTHSAGFEDRMFGHLIKVTEAELQPLSRYLREERPRRIREPGTIHSYSNYGAALAGAAVEHVTGRSWHEIIEIDIAGPLGMAHTSAREPYQARGDLPPPMPAGLAADVSKGYRWNGIAHVPQPNEYIVQVAPAGVISSTAGDMAKYMLMLLGDGALEGVRTIAAETVRAFRTPMSSLPVRVGNWNAGFLGAELPSGFAAIGHDGGSLLFFSSMVLVPELRFGLFVATNTAGGGTLSGALANRVVDHFYGASSHTPLTPSPAIAASAEKYDGFYLQTRRPSTGLQAFVMRMLARQVSVSPDGYLVAGLMGEPQRFVEQGEAGEFRAADPQHGGLSAVQIDFDGGTATRLVTPLMAFERVTLPMQPPMLIGAVTLAVVVSLGTLIRMRRRVEADVWESTSERRAAQLQTAAAGAWLVSAIAFGIFAANALADEATLVYAWPSWSILTFSTAALAASVVTVGMLVLVPAVWRSAEGRWTTWRRLRYTAVTIIFAVGAAMLSAWGALQPWNP